MIHKITQEKQKLSTLKRFADMYDFVDFGALHKKDAVERIGGVTTSTNTKDTHYMHATISGRQVRFCLRKSIHRTLEHGDKNYQWALFEITLASGHLPHILVDTHRHDRHFFNEVFIKHQALRKANDAITAWHNFQLDNVNVYVAPQEALHLQTLLSPSLIKGLSECYNSFDIEILGSQLLVYAAHSHPNFRQLQDMLEKAQWLAEQIENNLAKQNESAQLSLVAS